MPASFGQRATSWVQEQTPFENFATPQILVTQEDGDDDLNLLDDNFESI